MNLSILTIAWSMCAAASFMLGLLHLLLWLTERRASAYVLSMLMAFSAGAGAMVELATMHAQSVDAYRLLLQWGNLFVFLLLVSMVWFVRLRLSTARLWLALLITGLWSIAILVNWLSPYSLVYAKITALEQQPTFWGETFTLATGEPNPWANLANLSSLLIVIYVIDAAVGTWRGGDRRRAILVGGGVATFMLLGGIHAPLVDAGLIATPYMVSFAFLAIVLALSYELVSDAVLASRYAEDICASERNLESTRRELERLGRANMLGELVSALAHELNQPLAAILSNAQAARRYLASGKADPVELQEILDDIARDDKRAGEVIRSLRRMLEKAEVEREPVQIPETIREVLELISGELDARGISLREELDPDLLPVHACKVEIQQVIMNLLVNAARALSDAPRERRWIRVRAECHGNEAAEVVIEDAGPGVAPDGLSQIFEPFYTTRSGGLGMGLAICRGIVEAHGGRIRGENTGNGARFSFTLPTAAAEQSHG